MITLAPYAKKQNVILQQGDNNTVICCNLAISKNRVAPLCGDTIVVYLLSQPLYPGYLGAV